MAIRYDKKSIGRILLIRPILIRSCQLKNRQAEKSASYISVNSPENSQTTKKKQNDTVAKQSELSKQQEQLYLDFTQIINALSEGQRPNPQQVSLLISQQQKLVEAQLVSKAEAKAQIEFLIKVLPEMDHELHRALRVLEQTRT